MWVSNVQTPNESDSEGTEIVRSYSTELRGLRFSDAPRSSSMSFERRGLNFVHGTERLATDASNGMHDINHATNEIIFSTTTPSPSLPLSSSFSTSTSYSSIHSPIPYVSNADVPQNYINPISTQQNSTNCPPEPQRHYDLRGRSDPSTSAYMQPHRNAQYPQSPAYLTSPLRTNYGSLNYDNRSIPSGFNPFHNTTSPSPPLSLHSRGPGSVGDRTSPSASSAYGYGSSSMNYDIPTMSALGKDVPPFQATKCFHRLSDDNGHLLEPEIQAKIDKGFFKADSDWCCYRRNYFSVACSYQLKPESHEPGRERVFLQREGRTDVVNDFYVSIAAKVNGEDGRAIELVQHTAKRDKGPMTQPEKKLLKPNPSGNLHTYTGGPAFGSPQSGGMDMPESFHMGVLQDNPIVANFERIQFKKATANNGKRRAAQQYFHIVVELYAKVTKPNGTEDFVKIAHRESDQMVVRGRSPGHYSDGVRSPGNMDGGTGSGGIFGPIARGPGASMGMGSHGSMMTSYPSRPPGDHPNYDNQPQDHSGSYMNTAPESPSQSFYNHQSVAGGRKTEGHSISRPPSNHFYGSLSYNDPEYTPGSGIVSVPPASPGNSSYYEPSGEYRTTSPVKQELYLKQENGPPIPLPMLSNLTNTYNAFQPPRNYRSWHPQTQRYNISTMSAG